MFQPWTFRPRTLGHMADAVSSLLHQFLALRDMAGVIFCHATLICVLFTENHITCLSHFDW